MDFSGGAQRKKDKGGRKHSGKHGSKHRSKHSGKHSGKHGSKKGKIMPKTMRLPSRKSPSRGERKFSRASEAMTLTDLQWMAKSKGIPFGGLSKSRLIRKINNY